MSSPDAPDDAADAPLVTFFVMAYRQEAFIREAIAGAFAQTWSPLEIILSDDNSPDGTFAVMQEMAAAYDGPHRVILNRNPANLGLIVHVNRIMELASGALVIQNAGDDISEPERAARLVEAWLASGPPGARVDVVHSAVEEIEADGRPRRVRHAEWDRIGPATLALARREAVAIGAAMAWTPALFERFGPLIDAGGFEDRPILFRAALAGGIAGVDAPLLAKRTGELSSAGSGLGPGRDYLAGTRLRYMRVSSGHARAHLRDMEGAAFPEKEACAAICRATLRDFAFQVDLARAGPLGRLAALPGAALRSLRERDGLFFAQTLKYAFAPLYARYLDRRGGPPRDRAAR